MNANIITFCCKAKCPYIEVVGNKILLGDANGPEGITTWTKGNLQDFIDAAKDGKFDEIAKP